MNDTSVPRRIDTRIKLLLLIPHLGGGGAERVTAQLARWLDPDRFEIHLGLVMADEPGAEPLPAHVTVHRLGVDRVRWAALPLLRLMRRERPDVVLSNMAHLNFLVLLLKPLLRGRTGVLVRQNTTASAAAGSWLVRLGYRLLYPRADGVICQSGAMADDLAEHFAVPRERLAVLANPVDVAAIRAAVGGQPVGKGETGPELLAVGRLAYEKGLDLLLRALVQLRPYFPGITLTILGVGPEEDSLRRLAGELGLDDRVCFAGHARPVDSYPAATLFVLPSRVEGMPNALLEAAAAGLPVVASPCCRGVTDLLRGAPGAWLAEEISAEALAGAIRAALVALQCSPLRYDHAFLAPYETATAVEGYAALVSRCAGQLEQDGDRPHVALVIPTLDRIGGAERQVLQLAKELADRGWRVTLIALSGTATLLQPELAAAGIGFLALAMRRAWIDPRGWLRYVRWARESRPDIVHAHLPHATWFVRWVRLLAPVRVVVDTIHTSNAGGWRRQFAYRVSDRFADHVTCVGNSVAQVFLGLGLTGPEKLTVLFNGLPDGLPKGSGLSARKEAVGFAEDADGARVFRWIAVGRLAAVKDYPTLLRAFADLPAEARLDIAGSGAEERALRALAEELGVAERVRFLGFVADVQAQLVRADGFVLSSLWEGLPVSVLEAAAAGLPVVATAGAGTAEAMVPGLSGVLTPVGDAEALSAAMAGMMAMPEDERVQMGERGRCFVEENFAMSRIVDRWEALYTELLEARPTASRYAARVACAAPRGESATALACERLDRRGSAARSATPRRPARRL